MSNTSSDTRPIGRPPIFNTPEEMEALVEKYFDEEKKPTITGLALSLGFDSRQSIYDYESKKDFSYIIKRAQLRIENRYEIELTGGKNPTGPIFVLKNMKWKDKAEVDHTTGGKPIENTKHEIIFKDYSKNAKP